MKRTISALCVSLGIAAIAAIATSAHAQTIIPGTINASSPNFIHANYQDVVISRIGARDYGYHVLSDPPLQMSCLSAERQDGTWWPIVLPSNPQYKAFRETIQQAFAMKRKIRIYTNSCARWGDLPTSMQYPVIGGIDITPESAP